jgi:hypothetical protein
MLMSMRCPRPVRSRWNKAEAKAKAPVMPVAVVDRRRAEFDWVDVLGPGHRHDAGRSLTT